MTFSKLGTDTDTNQLVYLPKATRTQGLYIIGIQGTGKSGLIENLIMQDINQQVGVCVLDPHGELIDHVIARLEPKNEKDVILLDINDYHYPFGLNLFTCSDLTNPFEVQKTVDQVKHVFEKLLGVSQDTPLIMEYLYNCTYTLVANPGYTMADIPLLLQDEQCRRKLVANVTDSDVQLFWRQHDQKQPSKQSDDVSSTLRRVKQFLQPLSRPIVGQSKTTIDLQKIMHEGKILLVKLSAQVDSVSSLIGSLMIALLLNAAYNRPAQRRQFHLYADEFQRFATEDFATLLEEARKFGIATTIAHQNRGQLNSANSKLETDLKDRSRSVGNMVVFKINSKDADDLAGEFDTTPPPAPNEVIGVEEIHVPKQESLTHLLRDGHSHPVINTFVNQWLRKALDAVENDIRSLSASLHSNFRSSNYEELQKLQQLLTDLNQLFYDVMIRQDGSCPIPLDLVRLLSPYLGFPTYFTVIYEQGKKYHWGVLNTDFTKPKLSSPEYVSIYHILTNPNTYQAVVDYGLGIVNAIRECKREQLYMQLEGIRGTALQSYDGVEHIKNHFPFPWYHVDPLTPLQLRQIQQQQLYKADMRRGARVLLGYNLDREAWCTQQDIAHQIDVDVSSEQQNFETFISQFRAVLLLLSQEENWIKIGSGQYIPKTKPGAVRPYQDVKNDIANQLSGLPQFTALVKIGTNAPQNPGKICLSCGKQSSSGALYCGGCSVKLPAPNEYTITTLAPGQGVGKAALQQRIASIQARNRQDGYTKARQIVEAEIIQRQTQCSGSPPAQPQQPQQPSPQQPRRVARQVPVQGNCSNCGASNSAGSKFCNQCGTRL